MASPSGDKRDALRATAQDELDRWEAALTAALEKLWETQQGVVLARLSGAKGRKGTRHWMPVPTVEVKALDPSYIVDIARWVADAVQASMQVLDDLYEQVTARLLKALGLLPPPGPPAGAPAGSVFTPRPVPVAKVPTQGVDRPVAQAAQQGTHAPDVAVPSVPARSGPPVPVVPPEVVQALAQARAQQVAQQVASHSQQVAKVIADGDDGGRPLADIADAVGQLYANSAPAWTKQIVQTNVVGAVNEASLAAATAAGVGKKQWLASHDNRVRDSHRAADGDVVPIGGVFKLVHGSVAYPGDPAGDPAEVINCRCTLLYPMPALGQPIYDPTMFKAFNAAQHPRYPRGTPKAGQWLPLGGNDFSLAGRAPDVRALISTHQGVDAPDPASTRVIAARDGRGRVSGYLAWQSVAEPGHPVGEVRAAWVHRAQRGQGLGAQLQRNAHDVEPSVSAARAPAPPVAGSGTSSPAASLPHPGVAAAPAVAPATRAPAARAPRAAAAPAPAAAPAAAPAVRAPRAAAKGGPTGDFTADSKRVDALQKKYLSQGLTTQAQFSRGGRYTAAREKQQKAVVDHFVNKPTAKSDSQLLLLGGLPGAGKTTFLNSPAGQQALGINLDEYVTVNADEVKSEMIRRGMVPDYPGLAPEEAATLYHDESFEIANQVMRKAIAAKKNVAYDTSLKSPYQLQLAQQPTVRTAPPPYKTTLVFVDVDVDVAKARAQSRYEAGDRYTPMGYIESLRSGRSTLPAQSFQQVKGSVDRWLHVENNTTPTIKAQGGGPRARRSGS